MNRFEKECGTLQKDGKAYLDSMRGMLSSLTHLRLLSELTPPFTRGIPPCLRRSSALRRRSTPFMVPPTKLRIVPWQHKRIDVPSKTSTPALAVNESMAPI